MIALVAVVLLIGFISGLLLGARETLALHKISSQQYARVALLADLVRELAAALQHRSIEYPGSPLADHDQYLAAARFTDGRSVK